MLALGAAEKHFTVASGNGWHTCIWATRDHPDSWDVLEDAVRHWLTLTSGNPRVSPTTAT